MPVVVSPVTPSLGRRPGSPAVPGEQPRAAETLGGHLLSELSPATFEPPSAQAARGGLTEGGVSAIAPPGNCSRMRFSPQMPVVVSQMTPSFDRR